MNGNVKSMIVERDWNLDGKVKDPKPNEVEKINNGNGLDYYNIYWKWEREGGGLENECNGKSIKSKGIWLKTE